MEKDKTDKTKKATSPKAKATKVEVKKDTETTEVEQVEENKVANTNAESELQGREIEEIYVNEVTVDSEVKRLNDEYGEAVKETTFVIPYLKTASAGKELMYALRSIYDSYPACKVVIIGDKEDFFSDKIVHLQHERESDNPQVDVAQKLVLAIASGEVKGDFFLTNDDIFLLGKSYLSELTLSLARGLINDSTGSRGGVFNINALRTKKALEEKGLGTINFGTHTPILLNAELLLETIKEYKADEEGHLLTSLYMNTYHEDMRPVQVDGGRQDPILASVYKQDVPREILEDAIAHRKFMNVNDGGYKLVEPYLVKLYPNKSKFEM